MPRWMTLAVMAVVVPTSSAMLRADDDLPQPIWWRQNAFVIPFKIDRTAPAEQRPAQVGLYVSTDGGQQWNLAQAVSPRAAQFELRNLTDGEYWFLIRTIDRQGRVTPETGGKPEMRVIVDTASPRLDFAAVRGESGEVKATWQSVDPNLNADSLKIEYQTIDGSWRPVAIDRSSAGTDRLTTRGTMTWWPSDAPPTIAVRASISDRAGNVAASQAKVEPAARPAAEADRVAANPIAARHPAPLADVPERRYLNPTPENANAASASGDANIGYIGIDSAIAGPGAPPAATSTGGTPWPSDHRTDMPLDRGNSGGGYRNLGTDGGQWPAPLAPPGDNREPAAAHWGGGMTSPLNPPIRNQANDAPDARWPTSPDDAATSSAGANRSLLPPGEQPRMVNSRSFELDYEVEAIGPSGIAKVELWGTRDGGTTWTSYGVDNDNRSPIRVNVEGEGRYGFRIAVQSGSGLGGQPPRSGDRPELWVGVDLTKPSARLTTAEAGTDNRAGELIIRWEASDADLATRPITLLFSDKPGGPWTIMAAGLENTGSYSWRPDNRAPDAIYLRLEARDEAGNVAVFEAANPVPLEAVRPEGRLRGVRPVNESASGARLYQFYR